MKMIEYLSRHIPEGSTWSAFGIGAGHMPVLYTAIALGGHVRVGLEDNVVYGFDEDGKKIIRQQMRCLLSEPLMQLKHLANSLQLLQKQEKFLV